MTAISDLVPDVRVEIPEIPSFVAERQLLRAARELCEEARVWRVDISITPTAATTDLTSLLPTTTELVDIISIKNTDGGAPVDPKTQAWLDINTSDWRNDTNSAAKYYMLSSNNTIQLFPTPPATSGASYYVRLAVKPLLTATTIDDLVANKHDELIIHGALAKLFLQPRKVWSDPVLGQYHLSEFMAGVPTARAKAADEYQTGVARTVKYGGY